MCVANVQLDVCTVGSIYMYRPMRLYVSCDGRWMAVVQVFLQDSQR